MPLIARGRTLGVITLVSAESGRRYGPADLQVAQELAVRAASAVDNAQLFAESDRLIRERYLNFVYQAVTDATGATTGIFVHSVDVTDQVRARQEIEAKAEELAEALERSNRELDQFAYVTSHDPTVA